MANFVETHLEKRRGTRDHKEKNMVRVDRFPCIGQKVEILSGQSQELVRLTINDKAMDVPIDTILHAHGANGEFERGPIWHFPPYIVSRI